MTTRTRIVMVFVGLALAAGGCASGAGTTAGAPSPPSPSASGCPTALTITPADTGKALCVAVGGTVTVDLTGGGRWQPLDVSGNSLTQTSMPTGTPSAAGGGQNATFDATSAGPAVISTTHAVCPSTPGAISCNAIAAWKVTVDVKP